MEQLKALLIKHKIQLKKAFGQNFLTDSSLLKRIVQKSGVTKDTTVLEIGPGAGALTRELCLCAKNVICYEIDKTLKPVLDEMVGGFDNCEIIFKDIMKEKVSELEKKIGGEYVLVANLPYYITTPIVMMFLENATNVKSLVIMVQEEVAERFSANPSTSQYGAITVGINLRGSASIVERVNRQMFTPPPNVDSAVVRIDVKNDKFSNCDLQKVREIVRIGFSSRRKKLVNNLMNFYKINRETAERVLIDANVSLSSRAENLSAEEFVNLAKVMGEK